MSIFLHQILLAGRDNNYEIFLNILFVVVMAVFWIVGGVMKSRIKKSDDSDKDKPQQKSVRMPSSIGKAFWEQFMELSGNPQFNQKRNIPAERKILPVKSTALDKPKPKEIRVKEQPKPQQITKDVIKEPSLSTFSLPQIDIKMPVVESSKQTSDSPYLSDYISFDDIDTDELRKAIVYKEIFGAPVSMRDMSES